MRQPLVKSKAHFLGIGNRERESFEFFINILDRSLVWCSLVGLVFSLPLRELFVCLTLDNLHVSGFLRSPVLLRVAFCREMQQQNNLPKAEMGWNDDFSKVHVLCCVGQLLMVTSSLSFPSCYPSSYWCNRLQKCSEIHILIKKVENKSSGEAFWWKLERFLPSSSMVICMQLQRTSFQVTAMCKQVTDVQGW